MQVDLLIHSATQLVACAGANGEQGPRRGRTMRELGIVQDGAIAIADGQIVLVGPTDEVRAACQAREVIDADGKVVCPGFVDPHTHVVYAGDRVDEFEMRISGVNYLDILAAGGGILSTMRAVRDASVEQLVDTSRKRLDRMMAHGTTTAEAKTGYGLDTASEMKLLSAIDVLDATHPMNLVPTFLGAHAVPPEYQGRANDYAALVAEEMVPAVVAWYEASHFRHDGMPLFGDVFCERNAFDVAQSRHVLEAARAHGMGVKAHVDEFTSLGGVSMALELAATSLDHLDVTTVEDMARIARSDAVAVVIPAVNFNLGSTHFADARGLIDIGAALALTTDINPGSAPCSSLPLVMAIACRYQRLLPAEALIACTINAAHAIGLGRRIGSLEAGKQADVLILDMPDYRHLAYQFGANLVQTVIKKGSVIHQGGNGSHREI